MENGTRLIDIVATAMELPSGERDAYIARTCGSNEELAYRASRMIAAEKEMGGFLSEPAEEAMSMLQSLSAADDPAMDGDEETPDAIGRYRIIRRIGRGGMGNVYLGRQKIGGFSRDVAVKVIRRGMDSESVVARFRMERSILASLNHPNIARLHDAGTMPDGRAFYVMEYVDGLPITEYCDAYKLSIEQRIHLFETVCRAAHYAHQNLVVHRDIKPTNILVTPEGTVKLLDFGIAKFLDPAAIDYTIPVTNVDNTLMTPDYASPEQIRGEAISTATDVYSLGILLYELLSGHRPFRSSSESRVVFASRVCEDEPRKPSSSIGIRVEVMHRNGTSGTITTERVCDARRTTPNALRGTLLGELDTIVLKAIRKTPEERYASVEQLREDIERYRTGEPIAARPATLGYRLRKVYERHRLGTLATALVLLGVLSLTAFYISDLSAQRSQAEAAFRRAENVKGFVVGLFEQGAYSGGITTDAQIQAALTLLEPALDNLDKFEDDPISRVDILNVVGEVLIANSSNQRAIEVLGEAQAVGASEEVPLLERAETWYQLARAYFHSSNFDSASHYSSLSFDARLSMLGPLAPSTLGSQKYRAWSAISDPNQPELISAVIERHEAAYGVESVEVADLLSDVGQVSGGRAVEYFERALHIYEKTTGLEHPLAATTMANLSLAIEKDDSTRALDLHLTAARVLAEAVGEMHPLTLDVLRNIGAMYAERKHYRSADSVLTLVEQRYHVLDPNYPEPRLALLYWHATAEFGLRDYDAAVEKLGVLLTSLAPDHRRYLHCLRMYLTSLMSLGRSAEAESYLLAVLPDLTDTDVAKLPDILNSSPEGGSR